MVLLWDQRDGVLISAACGALAVGLIYRLSQESGWFLPEVSHLPSLNDTHTSSQMSRLHSCLIPAEIRSRRLSRFWKLLSLIQPPFLVLMEPSLRLFCWVLPNFQPVLSGADGLCWCFCGCVAALIPSELGSGIILELS